MFDKVDIDLDEHPATAIDYALINVSYVGALAAIAAILHRQGSEVALTPREVVLLMLATFSLADVFAHERIATWMRGPFDVETADHRPGRPRGRGMRYAVGELMGCSRCVGSWSALGLVGLRVASPPAAGAVTAVLAASGANDFLQAVFRLLKDRDNQLEATP
jgi:hypothetical protein